MLRETSKIIDASNTIFPSLRVILIWGSAALFTIFQLFLEMLTNTMTGSLMDSFKISHAGVGLLSSTFFYTFLAMQFPVGIILDRFNVRWVLTIACAGCGIGCLLFGHSTNLMSACFARFIMGAFAAFGFLGLLKISAIWYPSRLFPFMVGFSQFLVMSVTAFGEPIAALYVSLYGWRTVINNAGYIAIIIALVINLIVKHRSSSSNHLSKTPSITKTFISVLNNKQCWLASLYGFGMFSTIAAFSALWGLSYLTKVYSLTTHEAAIGVSMSFAGIAIGSALFGFLASYLENYQTIMRSATLITLALILILIDAPALTVFQLNITLLFLGFFCGAFFLCFDIVKNSVPIESEGIAIAFCNMFVMSGTILLQPVMGLLIDVTDGKLSSAAIGYRFSLIALICTIAIAFVASWFIKIKIVGREEKISPMVCPPNIN